MTAPAGGESAFLHELELDVREELTIEETSLPLQDDDGIPTAQWQMDPYAPSYEVGLRNMLGAIEVLEDGSGLGSLPPPSV